MSKVRANAALRRLVARRANGCCEYCLSQESHAPESFSVEHVEPQSAGGPTDADNLAYSCQGCNNHKHAKTRGRDPQTGRRAALFNPRRQRWDRHFAWREGSRTSWG
jgi:5-methylcytosine-specific restriction endonuclease McrA